MNNHLIGKRVAFLAADGVEEVELVRPWEAVVEAGGKADLISLKEGKIQMKNHMDDGSKFSVDKVAGAVNFANYDALVIPGGVANPDFLRGDVEAVKLVKEAVKSGKPVAVICHGPWVLVEAECVRDRSLTSWPTLKTDIVNAGGKWVDKPCVVDGNLITSRNPQDLPVFCAALINALKH